MKKVLSLSLGLIFIGSYLFAQPNFVSAQSGDWNDGLTWGTGVGGAYPGSAPGTGSVVISNGHAVTLTVSPPNNPIGSLGIVVGNANNTLTVSAGVTLDITGGIVITGSVSGSPTAFTKSLIMNGAGAVVNASSILLTPGGSDNKQANVVFNGGTINISGNISGGTAANAVRTQINFPGTGTLNVGGNISGTQITTGTAGIINFTGSATQTSTATLVPANTLANLGVNSAASTFQLGANLTVTGTLTLTNGKINTGTNTLTLTNATPGSQLAGTPSSTSYVYSTGAGRLQRNGLAAATAYPFPIGTATLYLPVTVTPTSTSNFAMNVFSPASTDGVQGGPAFSDPSRIVNAVWNIERPLVGTGNSTITIQWDNSLEGATFATFTDGQIGVSRNVAGSWTSTVADGSVAASNQVTATFNAFSPFGVGELGVVLPVKFGSIKAYEKQNGIQLDWKVYSENKVRSYEIERSADGRTYTSVGSLPAVYNNTSDGDYGFFDANPLSGTSYYRIKNNDLDGKSAYSIVVRVNRNKTIKGLSLYPNPVVNGIVLLQGSDLGRGNYKLNIFGANGQEVFKQQIKHNGGTITHTIELPPTISKGVYMLSVKDENGNIIFKDKLVNQ